MGPQVPLRLGAWFIPEISYAANGGLRSVGLPGRMKPASLISWMRIAAVAPFVCSAAPQVQDRWLIKNR